MLTIYIKSIYPEGTQSYENMSLDVISSRLAHIRTAYRVLNQTTPKSKDIKNVDQALSIVVRLFIAIAFSS
jgi:hypothetical protein